MSQDLRRYLIVHCEELPDDYAGIVDAFREASNRIWSALTRPEIGMIAFGRPPIKVHLGSGLLEFTPKGYTVHVNIERMIFINMDMLVKFKHLLKVAMLLEELAQLYLDIGDEQLVSQVVGWLYPGIQVMGGKYKPPDGA